MGESKPRKKSTDFTRAQLIGMIGCLRGELYGFDTMLGDQFWIERLLDATSFDIAEDWETPDLGHEGDDSQPWPGHFKSWDEYQKAGEKPES